MPAARRCTSPRATPSASTKRPRSLAPRSCATSTPSRRRRRISLFSNWYLRRSRRRFWQSDPEAYQTLYSVLTQVTRVMAPALPFLTEEIYQNLVRSVDESAPQSVHLTRYPQVDKSLIDEKLERSI